MTSVRRNSSHHKQKTLHSYQKPAQPIILVATTTNSMPKQEYIPHEILFSQQKPARPIVVVATTTSSMPKRVHSTQNPLQPVETSTTDRISCNSNKQHAKKSTFHTKTPSASGNQHD